MQDSCSGDFIGLDVDRVRIENLVVGIEDDGLLPVLPENCDIGFVAEIYDLFIHSVFDKNGERIRTVIGNRVNGPLDGIEIAPAIPR